MNTNYQIHRWRPGDRVTRKVYMDDGTWQREGDKCLKDSPLKHGEVLRRSTRRHDEIIVRWDDGTESRYLDHGVREELPHQRPNRDAKTMTQGVDTYLKKARQASFAEKERRESVFTRPNESIVDVDSV